MNYVLYLILGVIVFGGLIWVFFEIKWSIRKVRRKNPEYEVKFLEKQLVKWRNELSHFEAQMEKGFEICQSCDKKYLYAENLAHIELSGEDDFKSILICNNCREKYKKVEYHDWNDRYDSYADRDRETIVEYVESLGLKHHCVYGAFYSKVKFRKEIIADNEREILQLKKTIAKAKRATVSDK